MPATAPVSSSTVWHGREAPARRTTMEDFPIWLKLVIWGTIGLTVLYSLWGMLHSYLQA